jgi:hypothetical protein
MYFALSGFSAFGGPDVRNLFIYVPGWSTAQIDGVRLHCIAQEVYVRSLHNNIVQL